MSRGLIRVSCGTATSSCSSMKLLRVATVAQRFSCSKGPLWTVDSQSTCYEQRRREHISTGGHVCCGSGGLSCTSVLLQAKGTSVGGGGGVRHSTSATSSPQFNFAIPTLALAPPQSMTHEHLAYAHCPICRQYLHVCDLYLHLTSKHKELNPKHCQKMCTERLDMYHHEIGVALVKDTTLSSTTNVFGAPSKLDPTHKKVMDDFLPTVLDSGGYVCNWCERRDIIHATRDQFLRHVATDHPELDVDEIDEKIPQQSVASKRGDATTAASAPRRRLSNVLQGVAEGAVQAPPPPAPSATLGASHRAASSSSSLSRHDFTCELCYKPFHDETNLLQHFESAHPYGELGSNDSNKATLGNLSSKLVDISRAQQLDALAGSSSGFVADCDLCAPKLMRFTLPSALYAHLKIKHPTVNAEAELKRLSSKKVASFPCPVCRKIFGSEEAMTAHHSEKHGLKASSAATTINVAGANTAVASVLASSSAPLANPFWCHACEKGFTTGKALHGHLTSKHGITNELMPCPACKRVFGDAYSLIEHISLVHKSISSKSVVAPEFACSECDRVFLSVLDRSNHMAKHHPTVTPSTPSAPSTPRRAAAGSSSPTAEAEVNTLQSSSLSSSSGPRAASSRTSSARRVVIASSDVDTTSIRTDEVEIVR